MSTSTTNALSSPAQRSGEVMWVQVPIVTTT